MKCPNCHTEMYKAMGGKEICPNCGHGGSSTLYAVILTGEIIQGQELEAVKQKIANMFKVSAAKCDALLAGEPTVIKRDVGYEEAEKYKQAFEQAGAVCLVRPIPPKNTVDNSQQSQAVPPSVEQPKAEKTESEDSGQQQTSQQAPKESESKGCFSALLGIVILVAIVFGMYTCTAGVYRFAKSKLETTQSYGDSYKGDGFWAKYTAWRKTKKLMEEYLNYPADSSFPSYDSDFIEVVGDYEYRVQSYVDASNALGARRRVKFVAGVAKKDGAWSLEYLNTSE